MDALREIHMKMKCQQCDSIGSKDHWIFMMKACDHFFCGQCLDQLGVADLSDGSTEKFVPVCSVCSSVSEYYQLPIFIFDQEILPQQTNNNNTGDNICVDCQSRDSEEKMYICQTCHELNFENQEDVKNHAVCSDCTIKKHIRKGHETVDYFPFLSAYQFSARLREINEKSEAFQNSKQLFNDAVARHIQLSNKVQETFGSLTEMARRSKSTKHQIDVFGKIETFINECLLVNSKTESDMNKNSTEIGNNLARINEWYEAQKEFCVDDSETVKIDEAVDA